MYIFFCIRYERLHKSITKLLFNLHFCVFFLGEKLCNREREMDTTENTRLQFFQNFISVALTGQSFFSFESSFSSFFCLLSFFSSFSRVLFFSFDSLISSSFSRSFCFQKKENGNERIFKILARKALIKGTITYVVCY